MKAIFLSDAKAMLMRVFAPSVRERLAKLVTISSDVYDKKDVLASPTSFADTEIIFSTWGMPVFTEEEIARIFPKLRCVFYAAGTVQAFARPHLASGVRVFSAWAANAVPVAEYTLAQILLAGKGFYSYARQIRDREAYLKLRDERNRYPGNYDVRIGLIGCGMIGSLVAERLKSYHVDVAVFDPFLSDERAKKLGVTKTDLATLFATSQVVSNHLANNQETVGMLNYALFEKMLPYATFLNTGRGAQVNEYQLALSLLLHPSRTFVADVIKKEFFPYTCPLFWCPNAILTPHIAGSTGNEPQRMAYYMMEEMESFLAGTPTRYEVTPEALERMA